MSKLPVKKQYIRGNNAQFMNKTLGKEIMKRPNLRNKCLKRRSKEDRKSHAKQKNDTHVKKMGHTSEYLFSIY